VRKPFLPGRIFRIQSNQAEKEDEEKTTFITPYGVFCYQVMPFGLKNAGATYQRMMQNCLRSQIGQNIQVYIDDIVITTRKEESLIDDLKGNLRQPREVQAKTKPDQVFLWCFSGTTSGIPSIGKRNRGKSREDLGNTNNGKTSKTA
jgi:hypothetical protein